MKAPDFTLPDQNGKMHSLKDYGGKWLVLYFYPKDGTPGCTNEACEFRDARELIKQYGGAEKFADKHSLNFTILSDESTDTIKAYNAWGKRSLYGKIFLGIIRSTFIIDPEGNIVKEYPKVNPTGHAQQIIEDLKKLQSK